VRGRALNAAGAPLLRENRRLKQQPDSDDDAGQKHQRGSAHAERAEQQ